MINLLPPNSKKQLRAARSNTLLFRYNVLLVLATVFMMVGVGVVYTYLGMAKTNAENLIKKSNDQQGQYSSIEQQAQSLKQELSGAKEILDKQIRYTDVILAISKEMPRGIVIDTLSLDASTFGTPTTFTARARDYSAAIALKNSLLKSSAFSDAKISSTSNDGSGEYPMQVNLSVTINKDVTK